MKLSQLFFSLSALVPAALAANSWIVSGVPWYDNNGKVIQAHGGGIRKEGDTFWWVGEDKTGNTGSFQNGFHLYSSTDLANWTDEGIILKASSDTNSPIGPDKVGERPKIIYNEQTKTYVLWFHSEDSGYALANVGVATAPDIKGPYTFKASWRPLGTESRDMSVYVDDDQKGYLVWATDNNAQLTSAQLTDDYTNVTGSRLWTFNARWEGSGIAKRNNQYNLFLSHQSGWAPNADVVFQSNTVKGPWAGPSDIAPTDSNTYSSQNNFELIVGDTVMYLGDRWISDRLGESTYVWQPLSFPSGKAPTIDFHPVWSIDPSSGAVTVPDEKVFTAAKAKTAGSAKLTSCDSCSGGQLATYVGGGSGNTITFENVSTPSGKGGKNWAAVYFVDGDAYPKYRNGTAQVGSSEAVSFEFAPGGHTDGTLNVIPVLLDFGSGGPTSVTIAGEGDSYAADISHLVVYDTA